MIKKKMRTGEDFGPAHKKKYPKSQVLDLPQAELLFPSALPAKHYLLVSGGRAPAPDWLRQAARQRESWALDRGLDALRHASLAPDRLLGDGDSANHAAWDAALASGVPSDTYVRAKDYTDTQIALQEIARHKSHIPSKGSGMLASWDAGTEDSGTVLLSGAFGGRFDHAMSTVFSASRTAFPCVLADEREILFFVKSGGIVAMRCKEAHAPKAVSLLPLTSEVRGVKTCGLHWELHGETLTQDFLNATSNEPAAGLTDFSVSAEAGILAVFVCFSE